MNNVSSFVDQYDISLLDEDYVIDPFTNNHAVNVHPVTD